MNPVTILRQPWAATLALGLCMWAQIPHSQHVFEHWAKDQSGWAFAWGFEAAVLMFVVRNMHGASWTFASLSALINVGYYGLQSVDMWAWPNEGNWLSWLLSLALPFTIAMYSHVLADVQEGTAWRLPNWAVRRIWNAPMWLTPVLAFVMQTVQPSVDTVKPEVQPKPKKIAQPPADSVQSSTPIVQVLSEPVDDTLPIDSDDGLCDGAPDPSDKEAYVRWLYMEKGLTQSALATQFGVHRNTIAKWLNGATKVSA